MSAEADSSWSRVLDHIKQHVRERQFEVWFKNTSLHSLDASEAVVLVPNEYYSEWLRSHYMDLLRQAFKAVTGSEPRVRFRPSAATQGNHPVVEEDEAERPSFRLNENYTFENFVVGQSNRLAHAAALAVVEAPGTAYNPLFVHGGLGLGKTHLLQAICHAILAKGEAMRIHYLSCESFMNQFISAIQHGDDEVFRRKYRNADMILMDDIHFLRRGESTQEEFFHTFNTLYNAQKQIILSSDSPPEEIPALEERLVSRFKWGLVSRIDPPDYEMRVAIINKKTASRGMSFPDEVVHYVANAIDSNIRELEGAITKIMGYASLTGRKVNTDLAREAIGAAPASQQPIGIERILKAVSEYFGTRVSDLQSKKKSKSIAFPRQICMYLARNLTNLSLEEIGGYFGGRDHTTVMYAEEKVRRMLEEDSDVKSSIRQIEARLRG